MAVTTKVLRKMCAQLQSSSSYEGSAMYTLPLTSGIGAQEFDPIADESILGLGFQNPTYQGGRKTGLAGVQFNAGPNAISTIFEAALGVNSSEVFTMEQHSKKLSICALDGVAANQYANQYVSRLRFSGAANGIFSIEIDTISPTAEVRAATSSYPASPTVPGTPFLFHEMGSTNGYFRVDSVDSALTSGDNRVVNDFWFEVNNKFEYDYSNNGIGSLTPLWGQGGLIEVTAGFTLSRHDSDDLLVDRDADTFMQLEAQIYKSATKSLLIQIPAFKIKGNPTDENISRVPIECIVARNGMGTNYYNTNMAFVSPLKITLVNS